MRAASARPASARGLVATLAVAVAGVVAGCDSDRRAISRDDLPEVDPEPAVEVTLDEDGFEPSRATVEEGRIVRVTNTGDDEHGIRSGEAITTGALLPGEQVDIILDEPGDHELVDSSSPSHSMTLTIVETTEP